MKTYATVHDRKTKEVVGKVIVGDNLPPLVWIEPSHPLKNKVTALSDRIHRRQVVAGKSGKTRFQVMFTPDFENHAWQQRLLATKIRSLSQRRLSIRRVAQITFH